MTYSVLAFESTVQWYCLVRSDLTFLKRDFLSWSQSQDFSQCANLAPDWLIKSERPIRSRLFSLTQLLTMTTSQEFQSLVGRLLLVELGEVGVDLVVEQVLDLVQPRVLLFNGFLGLKEKVKYSLF